MFPHWGPCLAEVYCKHVIKRRMHLKDSIIVRVVRVGETVFHLGRHPWEGLGAEFHSSSHLNVKSAVVVEIRGDLNIDQKALTYQFRRFARFANLYYFEARTP